LVGISVTALSFYFAKVSDVNEVKATHQADVAAISTSISDETHKRIRDDQHQRDTVAREMLEIRAGLQQELIVVQQEQKHLNEKVEQIDTRIQNQEKVQEYTNENLMKLLGRFNVEPAPKPEIKKVEE
jgi:predicted  nucleic acid-binding Zn-ribbon protein